MSANSQFTVMVHILTVLAATPVPVSSAAIADSVNTNPVTIRKAIGKLRVAGLVETIPGSKGGAVLSKSPKQISLTDVFEIVKEDCLGEHANPPNPNCPVGGNIQKVMRNIHKELDDLITETLAKKSINDIWEEIKATF